LLAFTKKESLAGRIVKPEDPAQRFFQCNFQVMLFDMSREIELIQTGWTKQSTHDEPRLSDVVEAYEEMGLEVHLESFDPHEEEGCTECMRVSPEKYKTIYTRSLA
jgi:hypothetical protein